MKLAFSSNAYLQFSIEETIRRIAGLGYRGIELLADVPHAWPAGLLAEQKRGDSPGCLADHGLDDLQHQRLHDERRGRSAAALLASRVDRARSALPGHPPRAHQAGPAAGRRAGGPAITTEPGGLVAEGQSRAEAAGLFYDELMPCVEVAEQLDVGLLIEPEPGLLIETLRAVPGVCRTGSTRRGSG